MAALTRGEAEVLFEKRRTAYLAEDVEGYLALWAEDMVIELPGREPVRGKTAYRKLVQQSLDVLRPLSFTFHRLAIDGNYVLAEWTIAGERRKDGGPIQWRGMSTCQIEDGLIRLWREYWDPADFRRAAR